MAAVWEGTADPRNVIIPHTLPFRSYGWIQKEWYLGILNPTVGLLDFDENAGIPTKPPSHDLNIPSNHDFFRSQREPMRTIHEP